MRQERLQVTTKVLPASTSCKCGEFLDFPRFGKANDELTSSAPVWKNTGKQKLEPGQKIGTFAMDDSIHHYSGMYIIKGNKNVPHGYGLISRGYYLVFRGHFVDGKRDGDGYLIDDSTHMIYSGKWAHDMRNDSGSIKTA